MKTVCEARWYCTSGFGIQCTRWRLSIYRLDTDIFSSRRIALSSSQISKYYTTIAVGVSLPGTWYRKIIFTTTVVGFAENSFVHVYCQRCFKGKKINALLSRPAQIFRCVLCYCDYIISIQWQILSCVTWCSVNVEVVQKVMPLFAGIFFDLVLPVVSLATNAVLLSLYQHLACDFVTYHVVDFVLSLMLQLWQVQQFPCERSSPLFPFTTVNTNSYSISQTHTSTFQFVLARFVTSQNIVFRDFLLQICAVVSRIAVVYEQAPTGIEYVPCNTIVMIPLVMHRTSFPIMWLVQHVFQSTIVMSVE